MSQEFKPLHFAFTRPQLVATAMAGVAVVAFVLVFQHTFAYLYANWQREEYSHGFLIPVICALLIWQRWRQIELLQFEGSWVGVAVVLIGFATYFLGALASITTIDAYALVLVVGGSLLAFLGWKAFKLILAPVSLLLLMNPIPAFLFNNLSSALQLLSSQIGVAVIRLFGISVFLEGNVIDLGNYKLQVVEACSGLRYLFPLLTLGVIVACLVRCSLWIRLVLVFSTVPITILMNSFRIGVIGVLVDRYGTAQAEGFLHDFEGWVIFMACLALLLLEMWLLLRLTGDRRPIRDILAIDWPAPRPKGVHVPSRKLGTSTLAALILLLLAVYPALTLSGRVEVTPARADLTSFPMQFGPWQGRRDRIESMYLDILNLDDYILADYVEPNAPPVNFYVAYYASQRTGRSTHSPASCLPGGGWQLSQFEQHKVADVRVAGLPLTVNRVLIEQGNQRQLVYYWFQQRGRNITNEYLVKWFLLWDSLRLNRTDGALIRLVTPLGTGEDLAAGDARLTRMTQQVTPLLARYVPD